MDGKKLKELRIQKGLSLDTLSEQTGISKSYLSLIEREIQTNPSLDILHRITKAFDIELDDLMGIDQEESEIAVSVSQANIKSKFKVEIEIPHEEMSRHKFEQIKEFIQTLKKD